MVSILSPDVVGDAKLEHFEIKSGDIRAMMGGCLPGKYVKLIYNNSLVMSDTQMEKRTNRDFCLSAHGAVLIGGLGIGMIVLAIQDKDCVESITIIEKYQDVIDLVAPQLPTNKKVQIICADVFDWKPPKGTRYDCIYMDIWNYVNKNIWDKEMKPLKMKWGHYLKPNEESPHRFNECWAEWNAKNERRL